MSSFLENQINDTNIIIKRKSFYKQNNFRNNNNNITKNNFCRKGIMTSFRNFNDYNNNNFKESISNNSYNLMKFNNAKNSSKNSGFESSKSPIVNMKYVNLKNLYNSPENSLLDNKFETIPIKNRVNRIKKNKIKKYLLSSKPKDIAENNITKKSIKSFNDFF